MTDSAKDLAGRMATLGGAMTPAGYQEFLERVVRERDVVNGWGGPEWTYEDQEPIAAEAAIDAMKQIDALATEKLNNLSNAAAIVFAKFEPKDGPGETAKALLKMELGLKDVDIGEPPASGLEEKELREIADGIQEDYRYTGGSYYARKLRAIAAAIRARAHSKE